MRTISFNKFDGGVVNDPRTPGEDICQTCTNFDAFTDSYRLTPYLDSVSGDSSASTRQIQNFCVGYYTPDGSNSYSLFGLGVVSGTGQAEIWQKSISIFNTANWGTMTNNQSASGATSFKLFVYYKKTGKVYGAKSGTTFWSFTPDGSTAFNDTEVSISYTNIAQGLVHSKDDILYVPYDNFIAANNNGSWNNTAITFPKNFYITSICEFGNYLAVMLAPLSGLENTRVYLWDRNATVVTLSEMIDWGEGVGAWIQQLDGVLIGAIVTPAFNSTIKQQIVFKYYNNTSQAIPFMKLIAESLIVNPVGNLTQVLNDRIAFMMSIKHHGTLKQGVWSIGKNNEGRYAIFFERSANNDSALTSGLMNAFIHVDGLLFQSYTDNGSLAMSKTNDQSSFTATSIYETTINPMQPERYRMSAGARSADKQLMAVAIGMQPLSAGQQVVLKYRADGVGWTTIGTFTSAVASDSVVAERTFDAAGNQFTTAREYEFRFESTGGAVITEFKYKYEDITTNV